MGIPELRQSIRELQMQDPNVGQAFRVAYAVAVSASDRLEDLDGEYLPLIRFEPLQGAPRGRYVPIDGYRLRDVITLDPDKLHFGKDMMEVLLHEMAHMARAAQVGGRAAWYSGHDSLWVAALGELGVAASTENGGEHLALEDVFWETLEDLEATTEIEEICFDEGGTEWP